MCEKDNFNEKVCQKKSQVYDALGRKKCNTDIDCGFNKECKNFICKDKEQGIFGGGKCKWKFGKQVCRMPVTIEASIYFENESPLEFSEKMLADLVTCMEGGTLLQVTGGLADQLIYTGGGSDVYPDPGEKIVGTKAVFDVVYKYLAGNPLSQ